MKTLLMICLVPGAMLLPGCGGADADRVDVYPVSGKVTMQGGPLAGASVMFAPKDGQPVAMGRTNAEGNYELTTYDPSDGAAEGPYAIVITKFPPAPDAGSSVGADGHSPPSGGHSAAAAKAGDSGGLLPPQYGSSTDTPLKETVKPEENTFDFEIK